MIRSTILLLLILTAGTLGAGTAGYTGIAGTPIGLSNGRCLIGASYTHEAAAGETITWLHLYSRTTDDSASVGLAVYSIVDGSPSVRLGAVATLAVTRTTAGWDSVQVNLVMAEGIRYGIAVGDESGAVVVYYGTGSGNCRSYNVSGALPETWSEYSQSTAYYSTYFTYESEGGEQSNSRRRRLVESGLSGGHK
jgi:hypothetical protein